QPTSRTRRQGWVLDRPRRRQQRERSFISALVEQALDLGEVEPAVAVDVEQIQDALDEVLLLELGDLAVLVADAEDVDQEALELGAGLDVARVVAIVVLPDLMQLGETERAQTL